MLALAKPVGTPEDQCEASFHGPESRRHSVLCCEWMLKAPRHKIAKRRYMPIRNIRTGYSTRRLGELLEAHQGRSSDISSASAPIASMTATDSKELLGNTLTKSIATAVWRTPSCVPCRDSELLISAGDSGLSRKMTRPLTCRYSIAWKRLPGGLGGAGGFACHFRIRKRPGRRNRLPHQKGETFWKLTPKRVVRPGSTLRQTYKAKSWPGLVRLLSSSESRTIVTGPSFTSCTCMLAWYSPVSTGTGPRLAASTK